VDDASHSTSAARSLRPFRAGYWFGWFNGLTWMMTFGTPMVLLLEQLRATTLQVGLVTSFVFVLYPLQILATGLLSRLGFQRQMVTAWSLRAVFLLVPLGIAVQAPPEPEPWMANAVVAAVFCFCFFRAFGVACHVAWFAAIVPDAARGRFFATEQAVTSTVGLLALLGCSALFGALAPYPAFRVVYGVALFGSTMAVASLLRLPPGPRPEPSPLREMGPETLRLCLAQGLFRQYLLLTVVGSVVGSSFVAFAIYYLKTETALPSSEILAFTATQFGGSILATWGMRRWLDRVAIRRFLQASAGVLALLYAFWLGIVTGRADWLAWVMPSFFVLGVALGINGAAHMTFLPELAPPGKRPIAVAVFGAAAGVLQGIGPMLWGLWLRAGPDVPGVDREAFAIFFAVGIGLAAAQIALLRALPETRFAAARRARG
jgi:hypothetical protein